MSFMFLRFITPILIAASAQSAYSQVPREVAARLRYSKSRTATVVVLDKSLMGGFASLVRDEVIADFNLQVISPELFDGDPQNRVWAQSMTGAGDSWLVVDSRGQLITRGKALPASAELNQRLVQRGVLSTERYLKQFLRSNPDQQEARAELINLLHAKAVEQTIKALNIKPEAYKREIEAGGTMTGWSGNPNLKQPSKGEMLDSQKDLEIWASFAQELDALFSDDSWGAASLAFNGYLAEAHSSLIQVVYGRHLNKIQDALIKLSSKYQLWQLWVRFKSVLPEKPLMNFLNELTPLPQELSGRNFLLAPQIVNLLIEDARNYGDWGFVKNLLWSRFDIEFPAETPQQTPQNRSERADLMYRADSVDIYQNFIEPLIEALVASNQERLVPEVIYRFKNNRGNIQNLDTRLTNLAKRLNRTDLTSSWIGQ